jgi:hypothetical protein
MRISSTLNTAASTANARGTAWQKRVELASSAGAGILGAGIGVLFADWLRPGAVTLLLIGAALHGWGMFARQRQERAGGVALPAWSVALWWLCWAALLALAAYLVVRR